MVAGKPPFPPKPKPGNTKTAASMDSQSTECFPTSSKLEFQETHYQKRKLPSHQSIPFTGSCQEDDRRKRIKYSEFISTSHPQNLSSSSSSPHLSSKTPPSLRLFGVNIHRIPTIPPPMNSDQVSTKYELFVESLNNGDGENNPKPEYETLDLISRMPSSLRLFGVNILPAPGIPSPPQMNSDQISTKYKLLEMGDRNNNPKPDYEDNKSPFFTLLEMPSSPLGKPRETQDLISRMPTSTINSHQVSTELTLFDESWVMGCGKINLSKLKGILDHEEGDEEDVSTELKLYNDPWQIKKKLTIINCGSLMCLLELPKEPMEKYLKIHMKKNNGGITDEQIKSGINMRVWDYDTETEHTVKLRKFDSYIFGSNWRREFVERRGLQIQDEIGLFWDEHKFRFGFRVLSRANNQLI